MYLEASSKKPSKSSLSRCRPIICQATAAAAPCWVFTDMRYFSPSFKKLLWTIALDGNKSKPVIEIKLQIIEYFDL